MKFISSWLRSSDSFVSSCNSVENKDNTYPGSQRGWSPCKDKSIVEVRAGRSTAARGLSRSFEVTTKSVTQDLCPHDFTMANVLPPQINFHPRPVSHAPSPFGFGFGLGPSSSVSSGWIPSAPGHTNPAAFHQLATSVTQTASTRLQKRRLDPEDDSESSSYQSQANRDESMDRSPTPERPKRAAPKRARVLNAIDSGGTEKENKAPGNTAEDDVDIGVLLG